MTRFINYLVTAGRVIQITFGFTALGFSIAICLPWDTDLAITVSAAYCSGGIAVCGLLSLLAMSQRGNVHWVMVMMLDALALAYCGGAMAVLTLSTVDDLWDYHSFMPPGLLYPPLVLVYLDFALIIAMGSRAFFLWRRGRRSFREAEIKEVDQRESWFAPAEEQYTQPPSQHQYVAPPVEPRFSHEEYKEAKSTMSPRPLSTVESMAHWSDVSGSATLTHAASIRSSDTKRPPSYASPVPSRHHTTIHRKPVY